MPTYHELMEKKRRIKEDLMEMADELERHYTADFMSRFAMLGIAHMALDHLCDEMREEEAQHRSATHTTATHTTRMP